MGVILKETPKYLADQLREAKTFKVEGKRADKKFPLTSPELSAEVGGAILSKFPHLRVDVKNPDILVTIEIREKFAFIRGNQTKGAGGMPTGTAGQASILISGGIDSPVAGFMMSKRGISVDSVYFESPPYTSDNAKQKVIDLASKLSEYNGKIFLNCISVTEIQEELMNKCDNKLFTVLLRRFMMRLALKHALKVNSQLLITGESIGQVASQTVPAMAVTDAISTIPVIRPLAALDKEEIVQISRAIETFDISILPYDDCCTVFTPKHPNTRPTLEGVLAEEAKLDVDGLVERAYSTRYSLEIKQ
jgi:thiamine biosynthesis protein ThiI